MESNNDGRKERRQSRQSFIRVRADSEGSVRGAFYANPMSESEARRKREKEKKKGEKKGRRKKKSTGLPPTTKAMSGEIDFGAVVNMAIEAEGGQDTLTDLVSKSPAESAKRTSKGRRPLERKPHQTLGGSEDPFMSRKADDAEDDLQAKFKKSLSTIRDESQESQDERKLSHFKSSESLGLSINSGTDRFFADLSPTTGRKSYGAFSEMNDSDSLKFSDRSFLDHHGRMSLLGSNLLPDKPSALSAPSKSEGTLDSIQDQEIASFSQLVHAASVEEQQAVANGAHEEYKAPLAPPLKELKKEIVKDAKKVKRTTGSFMHRVSMAVDPTPWLLRDMFFDETDVDETRPLFPEDKGEWSFIGVFRVFLWNPEYPEFTSLQQFVWSIVIGVAMGVYTAVWKSLIEFCVDCVWVRMPEFLKKIGFFTDLDGAFPMPHYMWICPTIFGCVLSYLFASRPIPIPGQNEWIHNVHAKGVQDHRTFLQLFILATAGMASGMSLGPELPLVLTAGMAGSYLGIITKQTVLQARVLNLVAAGSAVGGFFGFPMAGALFVLEIPHRMGLQYFEALSPAIFGSIVAVLVNRMIVNNDVTGYYRYPFLTSTLPSSIFWHAIIFGVYGAGIGIGYAKGVLKLKGWVHDIFHSHDAQTDHAPAKEEKAPPPMDEEEGLSGNAKFSGEATPLMAAGNGEKPTPKTRPSIRSCMDRLSSMSIKYEPKRAAAAGAVAGCLIGIVGMLIPHSLFWGEAQLQNLIDKGRTPLPIFGRGDEPTADLTAWSLCMVNASDEGEEVGFSLQCSALITLSKILVTGLSLGTGIIGGHFWGPLYVGCIASHFFTDLSNLISGYLGFDMIVGAYPCVAILCTMGATHVVTFRAHTAIMLILTLTISAFNPEDDTIGFVAGDYSAVFPLLVVAVYTSLMISRDRVTFYGTQRSRGDIMALPEVLCEPGKQGAPMIVTYDVGHDETFSQETESGEGDTVISEGVSPPERQETFDGFGDYMSSTENVGIFTDTPDEGSDPDHSATHSPDKITQDEIERSFNEMTALMSAKTTPSSTTMQPPTIELPAPAPLLISSESGGKYFGGLTSARLDQLLANPIDKPIDKKAARKARMEEHRRSKSTSHVPLMALPKASPSTTPVIGHRRTKTALSRNFSNAEGRETAEADNRLNRITSYGEITNFQPSLIDQARGRASSLHRRLPSQPRTPSHSRVGSQGSIGNVSIASPGGGPMGIDDIETNFKTLVGKTLM